jgi:hypothetical protein
MERVTENIKQERVEFEGGSVRFIRTVRHFNGRDSHYHTRTYRPRRVYVRGAMVERPDEPDTSRPVRSVLTRSKPDAMIAHEFAWQDAVEYLAATANNVRR